MSFVRTNRNSKEEEKDNAPLLPYSKWSVIDNLRLTRPTKFNQLFLRLGLVMLTLTELSDASPSHLFIEAHLCDASTPLETFSDCLRVTGQGMVCEARWGKTAKRLHRVRQSHSTDAQKETQANGSSRLTTGSTNNLCRENRRRRRRGTTVNNHTSIAKGKAVQRWEFRVFKESLSL